MILNVSVLYIEENNENNEHLGAGIINIKKEKITTQVINLISY